MEIWAKNDDSLKNIELGKNYKTMEFLYAALATLSVICMITSGNLYFVVILAISVIGFMYMYMSNRKIQPKQYEMEECYIRLSENYISFKQLVNGKYQVGKIYIKDITRIMKVEEGYQIWFDENSENTIITLDDEDVKIETVCINFFGYEPSEFIDLYLEFIGKLSDDVEKELDIANWKEDNTQSAWVKLFIPSLMYLIPILVVFIKNH